MKVFAFEIMESMKYGIELEEYENEPAFEPIKKAKPKNKKDKDAFLQKMALKREQLKFWEDVLSKDPSNKKAAGEVRTLQQYIRTRGGGSGIQKSGDSHRRDRKMATGQRDNIRKPRTEVWVAEPTDYVLLAE